MQFRENGASSGAVFFCPKGRQWGCEKIISHLRITPPVAEPLQEMLTGRTTSVVHIPAATVEHVETQGFSGAIASGTHNLTMASRLPSPTAPDA